MDNPFPYSSDNKRYQTFVYWCRQRYGRRLFKVPLDAGFTCPNRDGTLAYDGCSFCLDGSGGFPQPTCTDLMAQFEERLPQFCHKWPDGLPMAYFQAYSNTYAPLPILKQVYGPFISSPKVAGLAIATRCDCLDEEKIAWLASAAAVKPIWLELGLQSIHDRTLSQMNRGHDAAAFSAMVGQLAGRGLAICVHIIDGWPTETDEMMLDTARAVGAMPVQAIKIHMLQLLKGTRLAAEYQCQPFALLSQDEYIDIVIRQLELLPPTMAIGRLTGDAMSQQLLAPDWTRRKRAVLDDIDRKMARYGSWQGKAITSRRPL